MQTHLLTQQILDAKESRYERQQRLAALGLGVVITANLNLPGRQSDYPWAPSLLSAAIRALRGLARDLGFVLHHDSRLKDAAGQYFIALAEPAGDALRARLYAQAAESTRLATLATSARLAPLATSAESARLAPSTRLAPSFAGSFAREIKHALVLLEDTHPLGRLWDFDVVPDGTASISRTELGLSPRPCFICPQPAHECRVLQRHTREQLSRRAELIWCSGSIDSIQRAAIAAMLLEAASWPSPGLVSPHDSGSHQDMNYLTFLLSTAALAPAFSDLISHGVGARVDGVPPDLLYTLLPKLRARGRLAEEQMFIATGGVNTQKGLLFLMGVTACAAGYVAADLALAGGDEDSALVGGDADSVSAGEDADSGNPEPNMPGPGAATADGVPAGDTTAGARYDLPACLPADAVAATAARIGRGLVTRELRSADDQDSAGQSPTPGRSRGQDVYARSGLTGIRGELESGLPSIMQHGLPALRGALKRTGLNDALVHALISIMAVCQDTSVAGRHSAEVLRTSVWPMARAALDAGSVFSDEGRCKILELQSVFKGTSLNPGGSADLLAVTVALHLWETGGIEPALVLNRGMWPNLGV